jgi:hypothetical protein
MRHPRLFRPGAVRALVLALVFVAGNFGLPATDILLDHGLDGPHFVARVHFESRGGHSDHEGHCALARIIGELRLQAPAPAGPRLFHAGAARSHSRSAAAPATPLFSFSYWSRAPPPSLA